jgi:hypothetical protein
MEDRPELQRRKSKFANHFRASGRAYLVETPRRGSRYAVPRRSNVPSCRCRRCHVRDLTGGFHRYRHRIYRLYMIYHVT